MPFQNLRLGLTAAIFASLVAFPAHGALLAGFDSDFGGFTILGDNGIQTASYGVTPTQGTGQVLISTSSDVLGSDGFNINGTNAVGVSSIETQLGLTAGSLTSGGYVEGSVIFRTLTLQASDVLSFDWNFLTSELGTANGGNADLGFFVLSNGSATLTNLADATLADTFAPTGALDFSVATGYQTRTVSIATPGIYTLAFGVLDKGSATVQSALFIDNVTVSSTAVPEPEILPGLLALASCGSFVVLRLRKRSQPVN
jgi:hypothetical protein